MSSRRVVSEPSPLHDIRPRPCRVCCGFSGPREERLAQHARGQVPDEAVNFVPSLRHENIVPVFSDRWTRRGGVLGLAWYGVERWLIRATGGGLRLHHAARSLASCRSADVVYATIDSLGLAYALLGRLRAHRTPLVWQSVGLADRLDRTAGWIASRYGGLLEHAGAVVVFSDHEAARLRRHAPRARIRTLPLGIDVRFWSPREEREAPCVLSFGRNPDRDFDTVVRACVEVGVPLKLVTGSGFEPRGLPRSVSVERDLPPAKVRERIAAAAVVVVMSREVGYAAGQTSVLNALAMARPVVTTDAPWIREYGLEPGRHLLTVQGGDRRAVATAVSTLLRDRGRAARMGHEARRLVAGRFTTDRFAADLARLFREVVERRDAHPRGGAQCP